MSPFQRSRPGWHTRHLNSATNPAGLSAAVYVTRVVCFSCVCTINERKRKAIGVLEGRSSFEMSQPFQKIEVKFP